MNKINIFIIATMILLSRITSYNVCYTKLLRNVDRTKTLLSILALQYGEIIEESDLNIEHKDSVITSYSIHYTKLYDLVLSTL